MDRVGRTTPASCSQSLDYKIKIAGMPRMTGVIDVYRQLCSFGNIIRIDLKQGSRDTCAWVTYRPPPKQPIIVNGRRARIEPSTVQTFTVPSPINPAKRYMEQSILYARSITFGLRVAETTVMEMRTVEERQSVQVLLNLRRKEVEIQFTLNVDQERRKFCFRLPISLLGHIHMVDGVRPGQRDLVIPVDTPPQFFMRLKDNEMEKSCKPSDKLWTEWNAWYRQTDVVSRAILNRMSCEPVMAQKNGAILDIGRWTTYRLSFNISTVNSLRFKEFCDALVDHGVPVQWHEDYSTVEKRPALIGDLLEEEIYSTHPQLSPSAHSAFNDLSSSQIHLSYPVRYQLGVCLSHGYLKEHNVTRTFLQRLSVHPTAEAIYILETVADKQIIYYDPMEIFDIPVKGELTRKIPSYCVLARSVNITPTMIYVASPNVEISNRILREYSTNLDRFIRVKFSDEKTEGRINSSPDDSKKAVFERVRRAMAEGIVVAGRYYEFLAFGNSQFREHGAYFYAPTPSMTANDIRQRMGIFDHIKTVAKYGARLGQCLSTTRFINHGVTVVEDKDIVRNNYTFTDGVGKISVFLAQLAAQALGLHNPFEDPPSLYQFRLGGCKGVLALDPALTGTTVHIRESQSKFVGEYKGIEVIRASSFATACFNRQLIIVLSTLGVSDLVFIKKQQEMVNDLEKATREENTALEKLQRNIDFNQITLVMAAMILDGFMTTQEPFMMSLLQLWRAYTIKYLKEKARIVIEKGAFVLGCVDETATLRGHYDDPQCRPDASREEKLATLPEIFLQISEPNRKGHYKIIEGICMLARNPSLHAGDLRVVRAVDVPSLHHLKNVVVLPQTGDRDIANMCSGGDLDGDDYLVIWDTDFLPKIINDIPMDSNPPKPVELDRPITMNDVADFFVMYMKNDTLRTIATAHLAQADCGKDGVKGEKCLELAMLHSQAVDYPKSGIPAVMSRDLRPRKWPHFMENKYRAPDQIYKSKNILGMLYDQVELVDFKPQYENAFDSRILEAFKLDDEILEKAREIKVYYDSALRRIMAKHGIGTEFEAWSVFVLSHNQESRDYTFAEEFGKIIGSLRWEYRDACRKAAGIERCIDFAAFAPFVAAMYTVTAQELSEALKECKTTQDVGGQKVPVRKMDPEHMPLMSFPWLFVSELGRIATGGMERETVAVLQSVPRKQHKKHAELVLDREVGVVKTKTGVTLPGEMLMLNFGAAEEKKSDHLETRSKLETAEEKSDPIETNAERKTTKEKSGSVEAEARSKATEEDDGALAEAEVKLVPRGAAMDRLWAMM